MTKKQGFIDGILSDMVRNSIVDMCRNSDGTVDVNKALSVGRAKGYTSFSDRARIIRRAEIENEKINKKGW